MPEIKMAMPIASMKYPLPSPSITVPVTELANAPSRPTAIIAPIPVARILAG